MQEEQAVTRFTREQFYERVWQMPATKLEELGCSDVMIAKVCKAPDPKAVARILGTRLSVFIDSRTASHRDRTTLSSQYRRRACSDMLVE